MLARTTAWALVSSVALACAAAPAPGPVSGVTPVPPGPQAQAGSSARAQEKTMDAKSFADDVAFLEKYGKVIVLRGEGDAAVALSPQYQARVMTSAVSRSGRSLGWIHHAFIESKKSGTQFDNFGGEDRFWLGPEGGQFGLYFPPAAPFTFDAWQTPHAMQEGAWDVAT